MTSYLTNVPPNVRPLSGCFYCLSLLLLAVGCGTAESTRGDVSGQISIAGQPLNQGSVVLLDTQGQRVAVNIAPDGTFVVPEIEPGQFRVAVEVPAPIRSSVKKGADPRRGARPSPIQVPKRYASADTSGLNVTIDTEQPLAIDLKP